MHKHKINDPVTYMTTINFPDGTERVLKGKCKMTASLLVQSPRTLKELYLHLNISLPDQIREFHINTYKEWDTDNNTANFSKYSIHNLVSKERICTIECVTHPIGV